MKITYFLIILMCVEALEQKKLFVKQHLKGEEVIRFNLEEYFTGENITYSIIKPNKFVSLSQGITQDFKKDINKLTEKSYKSSALLLSDKRTFVFVLLYKNFLLEEYWINEKGENNIEIEKIYPFEDFLYYSNCCLYTNLKRQPAEVIIRCHKAKTEDTYSTFSLQIKSTEYFIEWIEDTVNAEDRKNPEFQYDAEIGGCLSEDNIEQHLYYFKPGPTPNPTTYQAMAEVFNLREDSGTPKAYTAFVLNRPYSYILQFHKYFLIYSQNGLIGNSVLLSNLTLPFLCDDIYFDVNDTQRSVYVFNYDIKIAQINAANSYWPYFITKVVINPTRSLYIINMGSPNQTISERGIEIFIYIIMKFIQHKQKKQIQM